MQKLGGSLVLFWSKGQKRKKTTYFGHVIPYNLGFRLFQKNNLAQTMASYTHAKIMKILRTVLE